MQVVGLRWKLILPVRTDLVIKVTSNRGQQGTPELIRSLADAVTVGESYGVIRSGKPERRLRCSEMR